MARYRLLQPHHVTNRSGTPLYLERGAIIDSAEMPPFWLPTPAMVPLDDEAAAAHRRVCDDARSAGDPGNVPGYGWLRRHPGGDVAELDGVDPRFKATAHVGEKQP